ncbi:terminase family protein [Sphingomonas bacterium]|uniref:DNA-packaging protein n=1 Tax=Sphingomonas bacterium TaxID=1895847 RepID=UPI002603BBB9|nr:terminase family protein [Sphingomonas bacterium]MDB5677099.1 ATP-binding protein [Sphingomonas bacterium]
MTEVSSDFTDDRALIDELAALPPDEQGRALRQLTLDQRRELIARWPIWAHRGQLSPDGEPLVWLIQAGRGFGKTRAGAEWVTELARDVPDGRFALVGATLHDARRVMVDGPAGVLTVARSRGLEARWWKASGEVRFGNGAIMTVYSAGAPEMLRGPEHHAAWCDEVGKWGHGGEAAFSNLMLGLRRAENARVLVTTTPRSTALVNHVVALAKKADAITQGRSRDNPHLPASFLAAMMDQYGGTRLGRQELDGELLDDHDGALWTRSVIEACRIAPADAPVPTRVVVAVDPPAGGEREDEGSGQGDACGIVAVGLGEDGLGYVLEDASIAGVSPARWAAAVAECAERQGADRVVAEKNQGGAMVRAVLQGADVTLPLVLVHASRGKVARAEPVSLLYEAGKVRHAGAFPALEDQLCGMLTGGGYAGPGRSPDRADALVWALSELLLKRVRKVGVRRM